MLGVVGLLAVAEHPAGRGALQLAPCFIITAMSSQSSAPAMRMAEASLTASTSHTRSTRPSSWAAASRPCTVAPL